MKDKKVQITVSVPSGYRWLARQPYGDVTVYKRKPTIYRAVEDMENGHTPTYWASQADERVLTRDGECGGAWKKSLQKI